jgi:hypothetical protein
MTHPSLRLVAALAVAVGCSATAAFSQSKEDRALIEKARLAYLTHPVPSSIACGVDLDWERFFQEMKVEMNDTTKARLEKLKASKIEVVSKGAAQTDVKVDGADGFGSLQDGLRQQLGGFFQMYWSESYGKMLAAKPDEAFELTTTPEGYKLKSATNGVKVELNMDKAYVITGESVVAPQMNASVTPVYKPGDDGLLRLRSMDETVELGATKMVISVSLDYQKVGAFEVPQHVRMALPGSFAFNYTFVHCDVKGPENDAPVGKH